MKTVVIKITMVTFSCLIGFGSQGLSAQQLLPVSKSEKVVDETKKPVSTHLPKRELSEKEQAALAQSIWKLTQDADSAKKLTVVVEKCRNALNLKLNDQHQKYFSSLLAWSLSKRAERRMDSFEQLMAIGNDVQANKVLVTAESDANDAIEVDATLLGAETKYQTARVNQRALRASVWVEHPGRAAIQAQRK